MSETWQVLLPKEIDSSGPDSIADFADCTGMDDYDSYEDALSDIGRYDAVIVRVAQIDAEAIARADKLKVIAKHGAGLDNVDMAAAAERDIVVCNTPGANAQSVAEHTIASLLGVRRHLHTADRHVRSGEWERAAFTGRELTADTLGLRLWEHCTEDGGDGDRNGDACRGLRPAKAERLLPGRSPARRAVRRPV